MTRLTVATGMRFGEITALLVADLDYDTGILNICKANTVTQGLRPDDLLFPQRLLIPAATTRPKNRPPLTPERISELGTFIGVNGRTYRHGTVNGYVTGKCKCEWCRQASSEYSVERRAARRGKPRRSPRRSPAELASTNTTGHCGRHDWGRVWKAAVKSAGIGMAPTAYQLRHTHASWLIEAGQDPKTVMKRLGHHNLATFSLYLHTVEDSDDVLATMSNLLGELG